MPLMLSQESFHQREFWNLYNFVYGRWQIQKI